MMQDVPPSRLVAWAISRSIWASHCQLYKDNPLSRSYLFPKLRSEDCIHFGTTGLIFKDIALGESARNKIVFPQIIPFMLSPLSALRALMFLLKIARVLRSKELTHKNAEVLIRAGLEATVTFLNFHPKLKSEQENEEKILIAVVVKNQDGFWIVSKTKDLGWFVKYSDSIMASDATLSFSSIQVACESMRGQLDTKVAAGQGKINLYGNIPLLDKFAYASNMVLKEINF